jgi:hypothetical protein
MKIATALLMLVLLTSGCSGSAPPPEDATDELDKEQPLPPDNLPPTMEEPPAPSEPDAPAEEPREMPAPDGEP